MSVPISVVIALNLVALSLGFAWWIARLFKHPVIDEPTHRIRLEPYVTCTCSNNHIWSCPPEASPLCPWCGAQARTWVELPVSRIRKD